MPLLFRSALAPVLFAVTLSGAGASVLHDYVSQDSGGYAYTIHSVETIPGGVAYHIELTSQVWRDMPWTHWLTIIMPAEIRNWDTAMLFIAGGDQRATPPGLGSREAMAAAAMARQTGTPAAFVYQIPNQPLLGGLREDALISFTFEQYLEGRGDDWPLLLPMTKGAVRAMDAVQDFLNEEHGWAPDGFVIAGASKRGWTAWLAAVVDERVQGVVPMVFDVLNVDEQLDHQLEAYGEISEMIRDYTQRDIHQRLDEPRARELLALVDPYAYREALTAPKLIILGANDPYWAVDAASLYFADLPGPKHLRYEPNTGHDLGPGAVPAILAFYRAVLEGRTLPSYAWDTDGAGNITVTWQGGSPRLRLWTAHSDTRDFRRSAWTSRPLMAEPGRCEAQVAPPAEGWKAYYVELVFQSGGGAPFGVTTTVQLLSSEASADDREEGAD